MNYVKNKNQNVSKTQTITIFVFMFKKAVKWNINLQFDNLKKFRFFLRLKISNVFIDALQYPVGEIIEAHRKAN